MANILQPFNKMIPKDFSNFAFSDIQNPEVNPHWNQPFHHEVKDFPILKQSKRRRPDQTENIIENNKPSYIPSHLPNFPPRHTYSSNIIKSKKSKSHEQQDLKEKTSTKNAVKSIQTTLSKIA